MIQRNLFIKQKQTQTQKANFCYQRGGISQEFEIKRCALLHIKETTGLIV